MEKFAKEIIAQLKQEQLHKLCDYFDDGRIHRLFEAYLIPEDARNFPDDYITTRKEMK